VSCSHARKNHPAALAIPAHADLISRAAWLRRQTHDRPARPAARPHLRRLHPPGHRRPIPAQWSRAQITEVALRVAVADGLDAVSMRRVAAELGTGAASLYRYIETREDLLDLMTDTVGAEYELAPPTGDWLADLIAFGSRPAPSSAATAGWPAWP
jgi:tetracycline repressor-like protein